MYNMPVFVSEDCLDRLPERDDIQNMLLQYQGHFDDKTSRLSCQMPISHWIVLRQP